MCSLVCSCRRTEARASVGNTQNLLCARFGYFRGRAFVSYFDRVVRANRELGCRGEERESFVAVYNSAPHAHHQKIFLPLLRSYLRLAVLHKRRGRNICYFVQVQHIQRDSSPERISLIRSLRLCLFKINFNFSGGLKAFVSPAAADDTGILLDWFQLKRRGKHSMKS